MFMGMLNYPFPHLEGTGVDASYNFHTREETSFQIRGFDIKKKKKSEWDEPPHEAAANRLSLPANYGK